jgi:hypothetical protein
MAISPTTGAEMVVMRRRIAEANSRKVPRWWNIPVLAILKIRRCRRLKLFAQA